MTAVLIKMEEPRARKLVPLRNRNGHIVAHAERGMLVIKWRGREGERGETALSKEEILRALAESVQP